jgi:PrsW family intramembrane metalloprotease
VTDSVVAQTMPCRACRHDVPAGRFCGRCGAYLTPAGGDGPVWLRIRGYAAAPDENVLQPSVVSSMFPHLPRRSRGTFRVGLALVAVVVVVLCLLRWQLAMVATTTFAPPLLLVVYLTETGVIADLFRRVWAPTLVVGLGVGVGWALLTESIVSESYSLGLGTEAPTARLVRDAVLIPFGGVLALQLPVVIVRLTRPPARESLYGFAVGALGATMFAVGATIVRLIPQIPDGVQNEDQPVTDMLLEAVVRGLTMPVTAASIGGLVGAGLWYARLRGPDHRRVLAVIGVGAFVAAALYACVGLVEAFRVEPVNQVVLHLALAAAALVTLRTGLQLALLHEPHEPVQPPSPILCPQCGHVVPDMAFCPACGVAAEASSRMSREARRRDRPQPRTEAVEP